MIFQTARLLVRRLREEDFDPFFRMESSPEVLRYTNPHAALSRDEIHQDLLRLIKGYEDSGSSLSVWAVENRGGDFLGTGALVGQGPVLEIGYRFLPDYWGKGYGKELCAGLINYAFTVLAASKVTAVACTGNQVSVAILDSIMSFVKEEYNEEFGDIDRYYELRNS